MHHVVVMQFLGPNQIAQTKPELMDQIHLVASEIRSVWAEKEKFVLALGRKDFEIKRRPRIRQAKRRMDQRLVVYDSFSPEAPRLLGTRSDQWIVRV